MKSKPPQTLDEYRHAVAAANHALLQGKLDVKAAEATNNAAGKIIASIKIANECADRNRTMPNYEGWIKLGAKIPATTPVVATEAMA